MGLGTLHSTPGMVLRAAGGTQVWGNDEDGGQFLQGGDTWEPRDLLSPPLATRGPAQVWELLTGQEALF